MQQNNWVFKAQALDNVSPDHYQVGEQIIGSDDQRQRAAVSARISEIALQGKVVVKTDDIEIILYRHDGIQSILVQIYSDQRDVAGRIAPIVCCGDISCGADLSGIVLAIIRFARNIGRTVDRERHIHLDAKLAALSTKQRRVFTSKKVLLGAAVVVAVLGYTGFRLFAR
jgi:hypothetical protein